MKTKLTFLELLPVALLLTCVALAVNAQPGARVHRIAWLSGSAASSNSEVVDAFRHKLHDFGWDEGRNIVLIYRYAEGQLNRLPEQAAELVRMNVDVIVTTAPAALVAARDATKAIPIVMVYGPDPVDAGLVASLSRPGGNITGLTSLSADLSLKQFEILKAIVPGLSRAAVFWNPANPWHADGVERVEAAARRLGIRVQIIAVRGLAELDAGFATMERERVEALLILPDPVTFTHRARLAELAANHRLPTMNGLAEYTEAGGLASYWPNSVEMFRTAASYVHRILNGARAGDLPVEQPTKFELVINMKTAKTLGLNIPTAVLTRADRVIE